MRFAAFEEPFWIEVFALWIEMRPSTILESAFEADAAIDFYRERRTRLQWTDRSPEGQFWQRMVLLFLRPGVDPNGRSVRDAVYLADNSLGHFRERRDGSGTEPPPVRSAP